MRLAISFLFFGVSILFGSVPANAADFNFATVDGMDIIAVDGEIQSGDEDHFRRLAISSDNAVVILASDGGDLAVALEIGKIIHLKGFSTYVPSGADCASACGLIWIAGNPRAMATTGRVGFHASYREVGGQYQEAGVGNAMVGRYLTLLNLPERAIIYATSASPFEMQWISSANNLSGIDFDILDLGQEDEVPINPPSSRATSQRNQSEFKWTHGGWSVDSSEGMCILLATFDKESGQPNVSNLAVMQSDNAESAYLADFNDKFRSIEEGRKYQIEIELDKGGRSDFGWGSMTFMGLNQDGQRGFLGLFDWPQLKDDLLSSNNIYFHRDGQLIDGFPLDGIEESVRQFEYCMEFTQNRTLSDPFAE